jgi:hypothetical protein
MNINKITKQKLISEFIVFRFGFILSNLAVWSFYQILLYKVTQDVSVIVLEYLFFYIGLWLFFILGSLLLDWAGYLFAIRFKYAISLIPIVAVLLLIDQIGEYFLLLAFLRAIPQGFFWAVNNTFYVRELHGKSRGEFISLQKSIELLLGVVTPILIGSLITIDETYTLVFIVGFFIQLTLFLIPYKYNKIPQHKLRKQDFITILGSKNFIYQAMILFFDSGVDSLFVMIFSIVPFIFIGNEMGVGAFLSFITFFSAISAYLEKSRSLKFRYELGMFAYVVRSIFNLLFSIFWTLPVLFIRNAIVVVTSSTSDTVNEELKIHTRELILKDFKNEMIEEFNVVLETVQLFGRLLALATIYFLVKNYEPIIIFRILIAVFSFYKVITMFSFRTLLKKSQIGGIFTRER